MADLPAIKPFDPAHLCEKCGTEGARPVHHERPVLIVFGGPSWPCRFLHQTLGEHFCFRCSGCGFAWIERVSGGMASPLGG